MAKVYSALKTVGFVYDFAVDGGEVSQIGMGVFIPANCAIIWGGARVITALTSGGSATIGVGHSGDSDLFIDDVAVATWSDGAMIEGLDLPAGNIETTADMELLIDIKVAALTAGKFVYTMMYIEYAE